MNKAHEISSKKKLTSHLITVLLSLMILAAAAPLTVYAGVDDYPQEYKNMKLDQQYDKWKFYVRECVSFVAWRLNSRNKIAFSYSYKGKAFGHAKSWAKQASDAGIKVDKQPAVGAVAYWTSGDYGHVAWVEAVNGDKVTTEEYNWNRDGKYHTRTINKNDPDGYIHFADLVAEEPEGKPMSAGYGQVIPDGDYQIVTCKDPNFALDIPGYMATGTSSAKMQLWRNLSQEDPYDVFTVQYNSSTKGYTITQKTSSMRLDVPGATKKRNTVPVVYAANNTAAQNWAIKEVSDKGFYTIQAMCSGYYLDIAGNPATLKDGSGLTLWDANGQDNQKWAFVPWNGKERTVAEGEYYIVDKNSQKRLSVDYHNKYLNVVIDESAEPGDQVFCVKYLSDGSCYITHKKSGQLLDLEGGGAIKNVGIWPANEGQITNGRFQEWAFRNTGDGDDSYYIISRYLGSYLDVKGEKTEDGSNVWYHAYRGSACQKFCFVPVSQGTKQAEEVVAEDPQQTEFAEQSENIGAEENTDENDPLSDPAIADPEEIEAISGCVCDMDGNTYVVTGTDTISFAKPANKKSKTFTVPATVTIDGIEYRVNAIEDGAFKNCKKLRSVTIGENVETIGSKAFFKCKNLRKLTIESRILTGVGKKAFAKIGRSVKVTLPAEEAKAYKKMLKKAGLSIKK